MQPFTLLSGPAAALPAANVDTDVIMPKQYLKGIDRSGLRDGVFRDLRFDESGAERPGFVLNREGWRDAKVLVVGPNFGCGSSREHAVWGLGQLGVRALIGTSFAGIFFDNCARNGLLAVTLDAAAVDRLMVLASDAATNRLTIDLPGQRIAASDGTAIAFEIEPGRKGALVLGLDAVGATLQHRAAIKTFERDYLAENPWLA
ncbi:3-isopropylmalate/(R)-2-methylmalate dehydratase small subunit [Inquilinus ginsengisoli]|uniref:3-isopropylmalate dehydratase small subunit n=1 Tax=Inquilinus ginsengisoli TaxID=363840 RepID=A0ABU1JT85_9PROT|nr:3-isopropylmalate dehydratase small subunit [Inquilinus ginsengisoli]MDR6291838.1 3-isopropylmalate/(R)-2-methylmalate dehydratase small subunit [Inquilinus ginsengisoli]